MSHGPAPGAIFQRSNPNLLIKSHVCAYLRCVLCHPGQRLCFIHAGTPCKCTCAAIFTCPSAGHPCTLRPQNAVFQPSYSLYLMNLHIYACTMQVRCQQQLGPPSRSALQGHTCIIYLFINLQHFHANTCIELPLPHPDYLGLQQPHMDHQRLLFERTA